MCGYGLFLYQRSNRSLRHSSKTHNPSLTSDTQPFIAPR
jgi:hypothetical protein